MVLETSAPGSSVSKEKKKKLPSCDLNKFDTSKFAKSSSDKPVKSSSGNRLAKSSADAKINALDQKWSDRFNWLEALLIARSLEKPREPAFQTVKVMLTHTPPVGSVKVTKPFFKPTDLDRPQSVDRPPASDLSGTNLPTLHQQVTSKSTSETARKQSRIWTQTLIVKHLTDQNSASL